MSLPGYTSMVEGARYYIGKPWLEGGRSDNGIDCLGHVTLAGHRAGFALDPNFSFGRHTPVIRLRTRICEFAVYVPPKNVKGYQNSDLLPGDVTCYFDNHRGTHLGVVTPGNRRDPLFICYVPFKKSCTEIPIRLAENRFRWVFRFPHQND